MVRCRRPAPRFLRTGDNGIPRRPQSGCSNRPEESLRVGEGQHMDKQRRNPRSNGAHGACRKKHFAQRMVTLPCSTERVRKTCPPSKPKDFKHHVVVSFPSGTTSKPPIRLRYGTANRLSSPWTLPKHGVPESSFTGRRRANISRMPSHHNFSLSLTGREGDRFRVY